MTKREALRTKENESLYAIPPEMTEMRADGGNDGFNETDEIILSSENAPKLSTDEIVSLLKESGAIAGTQVAEEPDPSKEQNVDPNKPNAL
jgi:hypothetical protein